MVVEAFGELSENYQELLMIMVQQTIRPRIFVQNQATTIIGQAGRAGRRSRDGN